MIGMQNNGNTGSITAAVLSGKGETPLPVYEKVFSVADKEEIEAGESEAKETGAEKTEAEGTKEKETEESVTDMDGSEGGEGQSLLETSVPITWAGGAVAAAIAVSVLATLLVKKLSAGRKARKGKRMQAVQTETLPPKTETSRFGVVGKLHNIGSRGSQQDSLGVVEMGNALFAVVADGMGGLADGDKVSQKIVLTMMQDADQSKAASRDDTFLYQLLSHANREVDRMLGASNQYKSGSTVIAVLAERNCFRWVSVGDSRIYLFRGGSLIQMNKEHIYETELLQQAVNNMVSFREAGTDVQRKRLTSFVGMGDLRHVDGSIHPVAAQPGDKVILMSDGVFNTITEQEIADIISSSKNAREAAENMEYQVLASKNPRQDNFTAVILEF